MQAFCLEDNAFEDIKFHSFREPYEKPNQWLSFQLHVHVCRISSIL